MNCPICGGKMENCRHRYEGIPMGAFTWVDAKLGANETRKQKTMRAILLMGETYKNQCKKNIVHVVEMSHQAGNSTNFSSTDFLFSGLGSRRFPSWRGGKKPAPSHPASYRRNLKGRPKLCCSWGAFWNKRIFFGILKPGMLRNVLKKHSR